MPKRRTAATELRRMQALALALLAAAALLFAAATAAGARHPHPGWGYLAAFGEAAMVGAIADWFAVVALFRRPLGLPIPHTAIIPSQKDRIGAKLADFFCTHFLATGLVLAKLRDFGAAARLAGWLADPARADGIAAQAAGALGRIVAVVDEGALRRTVGAATLRRIGALDLAPLLARLLALLTADDRHQGLIDAGLRRLVPLLDDPRLQAHMAKAIAGEVSLLRRVGLDDAVGRYATTKLVAGLGRLVGEMAADRAHPLRTHLDAWLADLTARLGTDPALREAVRAYQADLLERPALRAYLESLWTDLFGRLRDDLAHGAGSAVRRRIARTLVLAGEHLAHDAALRGWLDAQLAAAAPGWIERYREDIRHYIESRVIGWDAREMTAELERQIGRDLQFIRINGTLVGGLVGLAIHAVTRGLGG